MTEKVKEEGSDPIGFLTELEALRRKNQRYCEMLKEGASLLERLIQKGKSRDQDAALMNEIELFSKKHDEILKEQE